MNLFGKLKEIPIARAILKGTDIDEVIAEEAIGKTDLILAEVLTKLQSLRGRKIKLTVTIDVDEVLQDPDVR